jgi:hypothetical protein
MIMGEVKRRRDFERQHPGQRLGDAPVQAEYHAKMEAVARSIDEFRGSQTLANRLKSIDMIPPRRIKQDENGL